MHFSAANLNGVSGEFTWLEITDLSHRIFKYPSDVFVLGESSVSKCWSSKARHNKCFWPRSSFYEEELFKRAFSLICFPKQEQRKHIQAELSHLTQKATNRKPPYFCATLWTVSLGSQQTFKLGSLLLLLFYQGQTLPHLSSKQDPSCRVSPASMLTEKFGKTAHCQISLLNFLPIQEVNIPFRHRQRKFRSCKFCCHNTYLLNLTKSEVLFSIQCIILRSLSSGVKKQTKHPN